MIIQCPCCGERIEVVAELVRGQHVVCPYCGQKFSYGIDAPDRAVYAEEHHASIKRFIDGHRKLLCGVVAGLVAVLLLLGGLFMFGAFDKVKVKFECCESVNPMTCDFGGDLSMSLSDAEIGVAYFYAGCDVRASFVLPKKGILATDGKTTIYIETDRMYVDGTMLVTALYTCVGIASIIKANGDQVVAKAFKEVDEQTGKRRMEIFYKQKAAEEKARAKDEEKLRREREESEKRLQAERDEKERKLSQWRAEQERKAEMKAREAQIKWDRRDEVHGNIYAAIIAWREALSYLESVSPKPPAYSTYQREIEMASAELDKQFQEQRFIAYRFVNLKKWERAERELKILCEMLPDGEDDRSREIRMKLLEVEKQLKKRR